MAVEYSVVLPRPAHVPAPLVVRITVMREDGKSFSREELEALREAYPPPSAQGRAAVEAAIVRAPSRPAAKVKVNARTKVTKAPAKRTAAKRP